MITMKTDFDLRKINLDLSKELNLAGQIIAKDHFTRLERGQDANGKQMAPLEDATIARKGFNQILVNTGKMRNLIVDKATKTKQEVLVHPGEKQKYKKSRVTMSDVGGFHQKGKGNLPRREWFGVSTKAETNILKMITHRIDREIRRA